MIETLYPLKLGHDGVFEIVGPGTLWEDPILTLLKVGSCVKMRRWVRIDGEPRRKTIIWSCEDIHVFIYITKTSLEDDETVVHIRDARPLIPDEGELSDLAVSIAHHYALLWAERKARYLKLEKDWPELCWLFEDIRTEKELARVYAMRDDDMSKLAGCEIVDLRRS
jgi:hypothetical protein